MKLLDLRPRWLTRRIEKVSQLERQIRGYQQECEQVKQVLGMALGYAWYKDDQEQFPGATEADGVFVSETPIEMALLAANALEKLRTLLKATKTEDIVALARAAIQALEPDEQVQLWQELKAQEGVGVKERTD